MGNNFLEKISSTFFLECGWCWHNFFDLLFQFACFWDVWCDSFLDLLLGTRRKEEKIFQKKKFSKMIFWILFRFSCNSHVFNCFEVYNFLIGCWGDGEYYKNNFSVNFKEKIFLWKKPNFHCVFLSICTVFTCARSLVL